MVFAAMFYIPVVMQIRDVYPRSRIRNPGAVFFPSRIRIKEFKYFNQGCGSGFNRVSGSGSGFGIRIQIQEGKNDPACSRWRAPARCPAAFVSTGPRAHNTVFVLPVQPRINLSCWILIQEGKNDPQIYKKMNNFHVFKRWMFSFEG